MYSSVSYLFNMYYNYPHQKLVRAFCVISSQEPTAPVPAKSLNNILLSTIINIHDDHGVPNQNKWLLHFTNLHKATDIG